jgi:uncharacterized protein (DUF983 family)
MVGKIGDVCPKCGKAKIKWYDGWMGYVSGQCPLCHYDIKEPLIKL